MIKDLHFEGSLFVVVFWFLFFLDVSRNKNIWAISHKNWLGITRKNFHIFQDYCLIAKKANKWFRLLKWLPNCRKKKNRIDPSKSISRGDCQCVSSSFMGYEKPYQSQYVSWQNWYFFARNATGRTLWKWVFKRKSIIIKKSDHCQCFLSIKIYWAVRYGNSKN